MDGARCAEQRRDLGAVGSAERPRARRRRQRQRGRHAAAATPSGRAMGTPASVASDPPGRTAPTARGRKRASANIFQGVGLPELRSLFQSGGAERPEERARLVWRYAGQRRMARALRQLRRRRAHAALTAVCSCRITDKEPEEDGGDETASGPPQQH
ncbi:arginine vasopressin-induced protein 1 [Numida meleagris]|uniref:arginine vasopressin-induced protein 1 n=1 Tax=Numida meleagris TaxID=8996 RepID=UPI000B3E3719|nr:arginine vasopressin-induced protein 1 [Numida meleagris]